MLDELPSARSVALFGLVCGGEGIGSVEHAAEDSANDWPTRGAVNVPPAAGTPDDRPWWSQYGLGQPHGLALEAETALEMFRAAVLRSLDHVAVRYFDGALTLEQLDAHSDALAVALQTGGFFAGDRLAIYLQNVPQWLIALLGAGRPGASPSPSTR